MGIGVTHAGGRRFALFYCAVQIFDLGNGAYARLSQESKPKVCDDWLKATALEGVMDMTVTETIAFISLIVNVVLVTYTVTKKKKPPIPTKDSGYFIA